MEVIVLVVIGVSANLLGGRTNIKGKVLAKKLRTNDNGIYLEDPNQKRSSVSYAHVLIDVDGNVVTVFLKKNLSSYRKHHIKCPLKHVMSW